MTWFSCEKCASHTSKNTCGAAEPGCVWQESGDIGVCISSPDVNLTCEELSESQCDKYINNGTYVNGMVVNDAPCFFNGEDDNCMSQTSLLLNDCTGIKINKKLLHNGVERRMCDEAQILFGWSFSCMWGKSQSVTGEELCYFADFRTESGVYVRVYFYL
jgi:hypothetical protein